MKWIPLSERQPEKQHYYYYTDGTMVTCLWSGNPKSHNWTHWLELDIPPLPGPEEEKGIDIQWIRFKQAMEFQQMRINDDPIKKLQTQVDLIYWFLGMKYE